MSFYPSLHSNGNFPFIPSNSNFNDIFIDFIPGLI